MDVKLEAFKKFWTDEGNDVAELEDLTLNGDNVEISGEEYMILTDEEADERAKEYIKETVWAFNKSFLDAHSEAIAEMDTEVFSKIQAMCESANKTILRLIDDVDHFIDDAILSDGRGHFMSSYDGEENEVSVNDGKTVVSFYIYRVN